MALYTWVNASETILAPLNTVVDAGGFDGTNLFFVSHDSSHQFIYTPDGGATWVDGGAPFHSADPNSFPSQIAYDGTTWVMGFTCGGADNDLIWTSTDLTSWTARGNVFGGTTGGFAFVLWVASLSLFVAYGQAHSTSPPYLSNTMIATSPDGITWTTRSTPVDAASPQINIGGGLAVGMAYSPTLALLVGTVTLTSGDTGVLTSPDAATWTARTTPLGNYQPACWSARLGKFVVGGGSDIPYGESVNGTTWTFAPPTNFFFPNSLVETGDSLVIVNTAGAVDSSINLSSFVFENSAMQSVGGHARTVMIDGAGNPWAAGDSGAGHVKIVKGTFGVIPPSNPVVFDNMVKVT